MIITIFGATGKVGKQLVRIGLLKGHFIKAFGRNVFNTGFPENKDLHLIAGAVFDEESVFNAIKGSDAVLSALGGGTDGTDKTRSLGMLKISSQMGKAGVKRIIAVGNMGILNNANNEMIMESSDFPKEFLPVAREHFEAFEILKNSSLDWTGVAPPDLIDAAETGIYYTAGNTLPEHNSYKINTGDLALFMLTELQRNEFIRQRVGISN